jgi:hypothetical protein
MASSQPTTPPSEREDLVQQTLDALDRLMRMFAVERILYLVCAFVSFGLLILCLVSLFKTQQISWPQLAMVFGASGLIAASAARVSFFLNKSFDLVSCIIQQLAGLHQQ